MINGKSTIIISIMLLVSIILGSISTSCVRVIKYSDKEQGASGQASSTDIPKAVTGTITTGAKVDLITTTISPSGGTITVTMPGDPVDGLKIEVPPGAYTDTRTFKISSAPIQQHTFGPNFNPLTPLMTIDNGGGYASALITMKIPAKIPQGGFAMAFFYDEANKKLEGVPLLDEDSTSITIVTRHFSSLVVSYYMPDRLGTKGDSGFRPGKDDWQFENPITYLSRGICAGMSLSTAWYYYEKRLNGAPPLYKLYDNNGNKPETPNLWQDDSLGIRLASTVQADYEKTMGSLYNYFNYVRKQQSDELTRRAFEYAMLMTGEPQLVCIWRTGGAHALIVYKIDQNGSLYVADPNRPGRGNLVIEFVDGKFKPYSSAENAEDIRLGRVKVYDSIGYFAKSALIDWRQLTKRWGEFNDRTIGSGKDLFPDYKLSSIIKEGKDYRLYDLTEGFVATDANLVVLCHMPTNDWQLTIYGEPPGTKKIMDYDFDTLTLLNTLPNPIKLKPGRNLLGFCTGAKVGLEYEWVDFKWVNVYLQTLTVTPPKLDGVTDEWYPFTAKMDNTPADTVYEWYRDDYPLDMEGNATSQLKFNRDGTYKIGVKLRDKGTGRYIGEASAEAKITTAARTQPPPDSKSKPPVQESDILAQLHKTAFIVVRLDLPIKNDVEYKLPSDKQISKETKNETIAIVPTPFYPNLEKSPGSPTWSGTSFSWSFTARGKPYADNANRTMDIVYQVSGTVSPDGKTITNLVANLKEVTTDISRDGVRRQDIVTWRLTAANLPFSNLAAGGWVFYRLEGSSLQQCVTKVEWESSAETSTGYYHKEKLVSPAWSQNSKISVEFWENNPNK